MLTGHQCVMLIIGGRFGYIARCEMNEVVDQFIEADYYIFVTPMWNFSVPSKMKDYIDNIAAAGKTFKYTEHGPVGLLQNKKMVHIQSSGGIYSQGHGLDSDFSNRYLHKG